MPSALVDEVIARTGALLGGRRVYEVGRRAERPEMRGLFGGRWSGPQFILTHTPPTDETDPSYTRRHHRAEFRATIYPCSGGTRKSGERTAGPSRRDSSSDDHKLATR